MLALIVTSSLSALKSKSLFCKRVISRVMRAIRILQPMVSLPCAAGGSTSNCRRHHAQAAADQRDLLSSISTDPTIANCDEHIVCHQTERCELSARLASRIETMIGVTAIATGTGGIATGTENKALWQKVRELVARSPKWRATSGAAGGRASPGRPERASGQLVEPCREPRCPSRAQRASRRAS